MYKEAMLTCSMAILQLILAAYISPLLNHLGHCCVLRCQVLSLLEVCGGLPFLRD